MEKTLNKRDLFWIFVRSNFLLGSFNFERMQAMGFCVALMPALKKLYQGDELKAALKRHLEFFNTQPFVAAAIMGIIAAMEEKRANGADISQQTLSGVKVGLIGPLAGVGDPIFWSITSAATRCATSRRARPCSDFSSWGRSLRSGRRSICRWSSRSM